MSLTPIIDYVVTTPASRLPRNVTAVSLSQVAFPGAEDLYGLRLAGRVTISRPEPPKLQLLITGQRVERFDNSAIADIFVEPDTTTPGTLNFSIAFNLLGLPPEVDLDLLVSWPDQDAAPLAHVSVQRKALALDYRPRWRQVPLQTQGRTGSTLFMRLIGRHPELLVKDGYPFEFKGAHYYMSLVRTLTEPVEGHRVIDSNVIHDCYSHLLPPNLYYQPNSLDKRTQLVLGRIAPGRIAELSLRQIDDLYDAIWLQQHSPTGGSPEPFGGIFLEKQVPYPALCNELYHHNKRIFLLRDPRDVICSIIAYQDKVGSIFGRTVSWDDRPFVERICGVFRDLCSACVTQRESALLVRYEDLMRWPEQTLADIFRYIGVDDAPLTVQSVVAETHREAAQLARHRTSTSDGASTRRWQKDMPIATQAWCRAYLDEAAATLGYGENGY